VIPHRWMIRIDFLNSSLAVNSLNTIETEYMIAILKQIVNSPSWIFSVTLLIPSRCTRNCAIFCARPHGDTQPN
jgi:hypothetical protein